MTRVFTNLVQSTNNRAICSWRTSQSPEKVVDSGQWQEHIVVCFSLWINSSSKVMCFYQLWHYSKAAVNKLVISIFKKMVLVPPQVIQLGNGSEFQNKSWVSDYQDPSLIQIWCKSSVVRMRHATLDALPPQWRMDEHISAIYNGTSARSCSEETWPDSTLWRKLQLVYTDMMDSRTYNRNSS